jgi:poly-gamma-glutamate synthesis protein (capsule biosynthesis protein)
VTRADGSEYQGFVCYSLGNFISAQNDPLTDTTAVLTLDLTKDPNTGETTVSDYTYHPMLMLDREEGPERYELLDVQETLAAGDISAGLEAQLQQALADCAEIWGSEHMAS